ncbi:MAG: hypothetical protein AAF447_03900 [Myxococcota bacterium]
MRTISPALLLLALIACGDDDGTTGIAADMTVNVDSGGSDPDGGGDETDFERACGDFYRAALPCIPSLTEDFIVSTCTALESGLRSAGESQACTDAIVAALECGTLTSCDAEPDCAAEEIVVEEECDIVEAPSL